MIKNELQIEELTTEFWTREQAVGFANCVLKKYNALDGDGLPAEVWQSDVENYKEIEKFRGIEQGQQLAIHTVDGVIMYAEVSAIMRPESRD